jgi:hypothetical protein
LDIHREKKEMSSTTHLPAWMEPEAREAAGQEQLKASNDKLAPYTKPIPNAEQQLAVEIDAGSGAPMQITWYYSATTEGGKVEHRAWEGIDIRKVFNDLATEWRHETAAQSFVTSKVIHFAYQSIIGLGPAVVPLLLESLAEQPQDWFWALAAIAREDAAEGVDSMEEAARAWLEWGRRPKGLLLGKPS